MPEFRQSRNWPFRAPNLRPQPYACGVLSFLPIHIAVFCWYQANILLPATPRRVVREGQDRVNLHDAFNDILTSLHDAMLDDAHWAATSRLIDEACGIGGSALVVGKGRSQADGQIFLARFCYRGERRPDRERWYFDNYYPWDERIPRVAGLPDGQLVAVSDLYTEQELNTSPAFNEALPRGGYQRGLNARLDGPNGSSIVWTLADSTEGIAWGSAQTGMIERLLPHIRQYVRVRTVVSGALALGNTLSGLLANGRVGVIHLDPQGRIAETNGRARGILRQGEGLFDEGGFLGARLPGDDDRLKRLLAQALPRFGEAATSGSLMVRRPSGQPRLAVHLSPVSTASNDDGLKSVAVLVLVVDPATRGEIDPAVVSSALDLTPSQSEVAVMLTQGFSVQAIATATGRQPSTVRQFLKQIYKRRELTGRADLVRLVLSLADLPGAAV